MEPENVGLICTVSSVFQGGEETPQEKEARREHDDELQVSANLASALAAFTLRKKNVKYFSWDTGDNHEDASPLRPTPLLRHKSETALERHLLKELCGAGHLHGLLGKCLAAVKCSDTDTEQQHLAVLFFNLCQNLAVCRCIGQVGLSEHYDGVECLGAFYEQLESAETPALLNAYYRDVNLLSSVLAEPPPLNTETRESPPYKLKEVMRFTILQLKRDQGSKTRLRHMSDRRGSVSLKNLVYDQLYNKPEVAHARWLFDRMQKKTTQK
jgi:hypothetical protein